MTIPRIDCIPLAGQPHLPPLVVGPSLGTSVTALWSAAAKLLGARWHVIGWDLPGHGVSPPPRTSFTVADLAQAVNVLCQEKTGAAEFAYAGVSAGGAVGLQLLLDQPDRITAAALICTGATIGRADDWRIRARRVRADGTAALVQPAQQRWFAPGFADREPQRCASLFDSLRSADSHGYAQTCQALADFDVRDRLNTVSTPVVAIAGADDIVTPPTSLRLLAALVGGQFVELARTGHLAPAERPRRVVNIISALIDGVHR